MVAKEPKRRARSANRLRVADLPDGIVFACCERFLGPPQRSATEVAHDLQRDFGMPDLTREQVYPIVAEALRRGHVVLSPPRERLLEQRLADRYRLELGAVEVLDVRGDAVGDLVAAAAAARVAALVAEVAEHKRRAPAAAASADGADAVGAGRVHLGLGAGWTTMAVARRLAALLRGQVDVPDLTLHALSAGYSPLRPRTAPVAFFNFFHEVPASVEYVGMFAPAAVRQEEMAGVQGWLGVDEAFRRRADIDIVVTSLASAADEHGQLRQFMQGAPPAGLERLLEAGWLGDVQCRPYAASGPIVVDTGVQAVTLFEIADLVRLARDPHKRVVLVAAPCGLCRKTKSEALRPLLESRSLALWSHLVLDAATARGLL